MTPPAKDGLTAYIEETERKLFSDARRSHRDIVRAWIVIVLFGAFLIVFAAKTYYAQAVGFKDTCALDQHFDPVLSGLAGAFTTILGFYFRDRAAK
jgi:hypothetical protein